MNPPAPPSPPPPASSGGAPGPAPRRRLTFRTALSAHGEPMVWLFGGALAICLLMILGLLYVVFANGLATFWPEPLVQVKTRAGKVYLGEVVREETDYRPEAPVLQDLPPEVREKIQNDGGIVRRRLLHTANFDVTQTHHTWVSDFDIVEESHPPWALLIERATNDGRFVGLPAAFLIDDKEVVTDPEEIWQQFRAHHPEIASGISPARADRKGRSRGPQRRRSTSGLAQRRN